jgi:hypothetical protein
MVLIALVTGAVAGLKPTAGQLVKDAYAGLKQIIKDRYQRVSVEMLENDPGDKTRQQILKSDLEKTAAATDDELLRRARAVIEAVSDRDPEAAAAVGVKFDDLKAASLRLDDIVAAGTGVDIKRAELTGDVVITQVRAGQPAGPAGSQSPESHANPQTR